MEQIRDFYENRKDPLTIWLNQTLCAKNKTESRPLSYRIVRKKKRPRFFEISAATKRKEKLVKQLKECKGYVAKVAHIALSRIDIDLDDGVKKNYRKVQTASDGRFCEILADSKNIMAKE